MYSLEAPPSFRRLTLGVALLAASLEIGVFVVVWRLGLMVDPGEDRRAAIAFLMLGTVLTLQAMAVMGIGWVLVAMARTSLRWYEDQVELEHPWRSWHGTWPDIRRAWRHSGWLVLEVQGEWRRWYVRVTGSDAALAVLRAELPSGTWLEGSAKHVHLVRNVLPIVLAATGIGGLALVGVLHYIDDLLRVP